MELHNGAASEKYDGPHCRRNLDRTGLGSRPGSSELLDLRLSSGGAGKEGWKRRGPRSMVETIKSGQGETASVSGSL